MEIEKYSKEYLHYYTQDIPALIGSVFKSFAVNDFADLGAGDGSLLYSLFAAGYLDKVSSVKAVDMSGERLSNAAGIDSRIECFPGDVRNLEMIKDESLDFCVLNQVIEHVVEHEKVVAEAYRILRAKGILYVATVFKKWYGWYFYRSRGKWALDPTHVREYRKDCELLGLIRGQEFEVVEEKKMLYWFPLTDFIIKRVMPPQKARMAYRYGLLKALRKVALPIPGYYNWEMLLRKR